MNENLKNVGPKNKNPETKTQDAWASLASAEIESNKAPVLREENINDNGKRATNDSEDAVYYWGSI